MVVLLALQAIPGTEMQVQAQQLREQEPEGVGLVALTSMLMEEPVTVRWIMPAPALTQLGPAVLILQ